MSSHFVKIFQKDLAGDASPIDTPNINNVIPKTVARILIDRSEVWA
jgi:hypothetical protein